jgi:hypothetical protein
MSQFAEELKQSLVPQQAGGLPDGSRGPQRSGDPRQALEYFRHPGEGCQRSATPAGSMRNSKPHSGGIAALNPRLPCVNPPGWWRWMNAAPWMSGTSQRRRIAEQPVRARRTFGTVVISTHGSCPPNASRLVRSVPCPARMMRRRRGSFHTNKIQVRHSPRHNPYETSGWSPQAQSSSARCHTPRHRETPLGSGARQSEVCENRSHGLKSLTVRLGQKMCTTGFGKSFCPHENARA